MTGVTPAVRICAYFASERVERYNIVSAGDLREAVKRLDAVTGTIDQNQPGRQKPESSKSLCDNS
jgi:hypothetical protein